MQTSAVTRPSLIPPASRQAPGLGSALGLIVLYFLLQSMTGLLIVLAMGLIAGVQDGTPAAHAATRVLLAQPGTQALLVMLSLGIAAVLILHLARRRWRELWSLAQPPGFGMVAPRQAWFFALAILAGLAVPLLGGWLTHLLAGEHPVTQNIEQLGGQTPWGLRIMLALLVVSLGPLVEELLFRGVLLSALLRRWRVGWAVTISSLLFAAIHLPGLQFHWYAVPQLGLLALVLAWLRLRSASLWPAVLAHGVHNLLPVLAWFVAIKPPG